MEARKKRSELSEDLRNLIVEKHGQSQGYKSIAKDLNLSVTTVRSIIWKFKAHGTVANLPRCGRKRKLDARCQQKIALMVYEEPQLTHRDIQAVLQTQGIIVAPSTISRYLRRYNEGHRRTPLQTQRHTEMLSNDDYPFEEKQHYSDNKDVLNESEICANSNPQEKALHKAQRKPKLRKSSSPDSNSKSFSESEDMGEVDLHSPKGKVPLNNRKSVMGKGRGRPKKGGVGGKGVLGVGCGIRPVEQLIKEMNLLLKEYLVSGDVAEAEHCLRDLEVPNFHHELVYEAVVMVLEATGGNVSQRMMKLLQSFCKSSLVTIDQMNRGFQRVYDELSEISLDMPCVHSIMEDFVELCYQESVITKQLRDACPSRGRFVSDGDRGIKN